MRSKHNDLIWTFGFHLRALLFAFGLLVWLVGRNSWPGCSSALVQLHLQRLACIAFAVLFPPGYNHYVLFSYLLDSNHVIHVILLLMNIVMCIQSFAQSCYVLQVFLQPNKSHDKTKNNNECINLLVTSICPLKQRCSMFTTNKRCLW